MCDRIVFHLMLRLLKIGMKVRYVCDIPLRTRMSACSFVSGMSNTLLH